MQFEMNKKTSKNFILNKNNKFNSPGFITYLIERIIKQIQTLRVINSQLRNAMNDPKSTEDVNQLGAINSALMTAIIIRTTCLFDRDKKAASLYRIINKSKVDYWREQNPFFKKIIETRDKFEAHKEIKYMEDGKFGLTTSYLTDWAHEKYM